MSLFFGRLLSILALTMFITISLKAQSITQTLRGNIVDQEPNTPLPGATVVVIDSDTTIDNEMALTRAPAFTAKETKRYDGLFNDPTHIVSGYALDEMVRDSELDLNKRPSELQRKIPDASRRVLNIQLKELEEHELITKVIYPVVPPKVEYSLTNFGKSLIPVISALGNWGDKHEERLRNVILKRQESLVKE